MKTLDPNFKGAFFAYLNQVLSINKQNVKNYTLKTCKERFILNQRVFYFQKDFYLVDEFNRLISLLGSSGVLSHVIKEYSDMTYLNIKEVPTAPNAIGLQQISAIFIISLGLLIFSFAIFVTEIVYYQLKCFLAKI